MGILDKYTRKRVSGKPVKQNIDYIAKLSKEQGFKRSTIMSYWKDAVKENPGKGAREIYQIVCDMIDEDVK